MSENKDFFNLDDILAEFSSYSDNLINGENTSEAKKAAPAAEAKPVPAPAEPEFIPRESAPAGRVPEPEFPAEKPLPRRPRHSAAPDFDLNDFTPEPVMPEQTEEAPPVRRRAPEKKRPVQAPAEPEASHSRRRAPAADSEMPQNSRRRQPRPDSAKTPEENAALIRRNISAGRRNMNFDPERLGMTGNTIKTPAARPSRPGGNAGRRPEGAAPEKRPQPVRQAKRELPEVKEEKRGVFGILGIIFAVLSIFSFLWVFVNIHPDSGTAVGNALKSKVNMVEKFDNYTNNAASDALGELSYIPKIYTIAEDVNVAPKPNPNNFGSTTDPNEVMKVIESASALLGDQKMAFNPDLNFIPGSQIQYYVDDTILAIAWKEDNSGKCCSCSEVKIAHGSQIRRKVAGDTYSVGKRYYATDMAKECNAVVAINGDFYDFRPIGITVFQRELFRFNPGKLDSCHITSGGDFLFTYADELTDEESTRQFIKDNDVVFSLSFGPILIDNGEFRPIGGYPIGEVNTTYSRSAIGLIDELHYMLMTVNYDVGYTTAATLNEIGRYMEGKGCQKAYALDGGQTSVLMMNGSLVNHVDYGNERTMSDIIYFATAIPEEEAVK